jgi:hypothetical protein
MFLDNKSVNNQPKQYVSHLCLNTVSTPYFFRMNWDGVATVPYIHPTKTNYRSLLIMATRINSPLINGKAEYHAPYTS